MLIIAFRSIDRKPSLQKLPLGQTLVLWHALGDEELAWLAASLCEVDDAGLIVLALCGEEASA